MNGAQTEKNIKQKNSVLFQFELAESLEFV